MKEIKNLEKTAKRILKAITNKEKIILYGDADLDGISSVIILKDTIKTLGGEISAIYFPNREEEGYGLNEKALNFLQKEAPALLITLDCGIGNFNEVKIARDMGFEVVVIDHHEPLEKLPKVSIIVDPKQKGDTYPLKELATAGIAFRLSQAILKDKFSETLKRNFLELTALATLADMMIQEGENKFFIEEGLRSLDTTFRPGLKIFFEIDLMNNPSTQQVVQKIISALNTPSAVGHLNQSFLLLTTPSNEEAKTLAADLLEKVYKKQQKIKEMTEKLEARILKNMETFIIFEGDPSLPILLTGSVASRICNNYQKPTFIFKIGPKESQGAVRMPAEFNGVKALINCKDFLETYGGHPRAAGFRLENKNLENFRGCLIDYFSKYKKP
jgi:single-stranded-DNA-specific exonuclease